MTLYIGPPSDPGRYAVAGPLDHVGGRADGVDRRGLQVELWLTPGLDETQGQAWLRQVQSQAQARHPGLATIEETFLARLPTASTWTGVVVTDPAEGPTLRGWIAEHPEASVPERLRMLRMLAAALDELHTSDPTREGVAHGAVTPDNIHVGPAGELRLAGFSPVLGSAGPNRYRGPEERDSTLRTVTGDAFSFAFTVAETLTGASLEADQVVAAMRAHPDTRRRALLTHRLQEVLTCPPDARPTRLQHWLDSATAGPTTDVAGSSDRAGAPSPAEAPLRVGAPALWLSGLMFALILALTVAWLAWAQLDSAQPDLANEPTQAVPLTVATSWAGPDACAGPASVALQHGRGQPATLGRDIRVGVLEAGGGPWHAGRLDVEITARGAHTLTIANIKPRITSAARSAPRWIYQPARKACGTPQTAPAHRLQLNLDRPTTFGSPSQGSPLRPLGPPVSIAPGSSAHVVIDVSACQANYEWSLALYYLEAGDDGPLTKHVVVGPFTTFGNADNTSLYQDRAGRLTWNGSITGGSPECRAR